MSYLIIAVALVYCVGYLGSLLMAARWMLKQIRDNDLIPDTPILAMIGLGGCAIITIILNFFYPLLLLYYSAKILDDI